MCGVPTHDGEGELSYRGLVYAPTGTGHFQCNPAGPAWVPRLQLEVGGRYGEKIPELLGPGKQFLPSIWGGKGELTPQPCSPLTARVWRKMLTRVINGFTYCKNSSETV